jgi:serine/threonine protein kinase
MLYQRETLLHIQERIQIASDFESCCATHRRRAFAAPKAIPSSLAAPAGCQMKIGKARGKTEAIQLVRSLPACNSEWLKCRYGQCRRFRRFRDCYVELRYTAILLYPAAGSSGARSDFENMADNVAELIATTPVASIEIVPLREAVITLNAKLSIATVRNSDRSPNVDVQFPSRILFEEWTKFMGQAAGFRMVTLADFEVVKHVGKGASGRVYLVKDRATNEHLALKVIEKASVYESNDAYRHALDERIVLELTENHPFILQIRSAFQNKDRLFLVTEYCSGGDLFEYLSRKSCPLEEEKARYIVAEILLALEHIHSHGVVYRDLKLENVLLDNDGHIRIADFGLSKILRRRGFDSSAIAEMQSLDENAVIAVSAASAQAGGDAVSVNSRAAQSSGLNWQRTDTFCGTREYVAPEMLSNKPYGTSVDVWAYGILLYEILCGRTPFFSRQRDEIYERIEKAHVFYPKGMSADVQDLLTGLLQRNVDKRLGSGSEGLDAIKKHAWFAEINWDHLLEKKSHAHSIAKEVKLMNQGGSETRNTPSSSKTASNKSKSHIAQDKAMKILRTDCDADEKATNCASTLSRRADYMVAAAPSGREVKVLNVARTRRRTPLIAGYSFSGKPPLMTLEGPGLSNMSAMAFLRMNSAERLPLDGNDFLRLSPW